MSPWVRQVPSAAALYALLLLWLLRCASAPTRYPGKEAGWRPDRPDETTGEIVGRMASRLQAAGGHGVGAFFRNYDDAMAAMAHTHEILRPATLKTWSTEMDDEMKASLRKSEAAFRWQHDQITLLSKFSKRNGGTDASGWPPLELDSLLLDGAVCSSRRPLAAYERRWKLDMAVDLIKVIRIFEWTFESMPDDAESQAISMEDNRKAGYPPPSAPPPMPPAPPTVQGASSRHGRAWGQRTRRKRDRKRKGGRGWDEDPGVGAEPESQHESMIRDEL